MQEKGIFDAIERQYLKSFIFAIYLDQEDPNKCVYAPLRPICVIDFAPKPG